MAETRDIDSAAKDSDRDFALWAMIIQTRDMLFRARDTELGHYGITAVEARALFVIKGLISRTKDPVKKNSWKIGLTDKGNEAYQNSLVRQTIHEVFSVFSEEERELLIESLQKICNRTLEYMTEFTATT